MLTRILGSTLEVLMVDTLLSVGALLPLLPLLLLGALLLLLPLLSIDALLLPLLLPSSGSASSSTPQSHLPLQQPFQGRKASWKNLNIL